MTTTTTIDLDRLVENMIQYYQWERATSFENQINIPSRKFALELLIEQCERAGEFAEGELEIARQRLKEVIEKEAAT